LETAAALKGGDVESETSENVGHRELFDFLFNKITMIAAITRLRTRSAAMRHWRDLCLSAYERVLVTNEKV